MSEPGLIGVMGDIHGQKNWTVQAVKDICKRLEPPRIILQAGDFGVSPDREIHFAGTDEPYLQEGFPHKELSQVLEDNDAELWFCEGNHEDHDLLERHAEGLAELDGIQVAPRITWLRRGARWSWHGKTWLACGGAVSVDKFLRKQGVSWFPQETISLFEEFFIGATGPADVLLSHDAPSECPLQLSPRDELPKSWLPMIPAAEEHRERLQRICVAVKPSYVFHGHYHLSQVKTIHAAWGECRFISLDMNGTQRNWGILDTRTMEWEWQ